MATSEVDSLGFAEVSKTLETYKKMGQDVAAMNMQNNQHETGRFGMLAWSNKDVYTGEWQHNKMWGYGCFRFR